MTKSTLTLTQSGLLAVLLERQRRKAIESARRRAEHEHRHAAFWSTFTRRFRLLKTRAPVEDSAKPLVRTLPRQM